MFLLGFLLFDSFLLLLLLLLVLVLVLHTDTVAITMPPISPVGNGGYTNGYLLLSELRRKYKGISFVFSRVRKKKHVDRRYKEKGNYTSLDIDHKFLSSFNTTTQFRFTSLSLSLLCSFIFFLTKLLFTSFKFRFSFVFLFLQFQNLDRCFYY
jgi:hypothetical protein